MTKTQTIKKLAKRKGFKVKDVRLAKITSEDIAGLPFSRELKGTYWISINKKNRSKPTQFEASRYWFPLYKDKQACEDNCYPSEEAVEVVVFFKRKKKKREKKSQKGLNKDGHPIENTVWKTSDSDYEDCPYFRIKGVERFNTYEEIFYDCYACYDPKKNHLSGWMAADSSYSIHDWKYLNKECSYDDIYGEDK